MSIQNSAFTNKNRTKKKRARITYDVIPARLQKFKPKPYSFLPTFLVCLIVNGIHKSTGQQLVPASMMTGQQPPAGHV